MRGRRHLGATTVTSAQIPQLIANAASQYGVPSQIALEVAIQESGLNPNAVSPAGAVGVMQLMPATAASLGVTNSYDPTQNINAGVKYLAQLFSQFGAWDQTLGAYNWGPGNVQNAVANYGSDWLSHAPAETQNYVTSIMAASGQGYTASITPDSVASGATDLVGNAIDSVQNAFSSVSGSPTILYLTGAALLAYFLFDFLSDD